MKTNKETTTLEERIEDKFGQIICIPKGYFDEVYVRFGKRYEREEKTLHAGQFLNPKDVSNFIKQELISLTERLRLNEPIPRMGVSETEGYNKAKKDLDTKISKEIENHV